MAATKNLLNDVLDAAKAVLAAREDQMLTADEWDALETAVANATQPPVNERDESFAIEHDHLVRRVTPRKGDAYEHRCEKECYEAIAHEIDDLNGEPFVLEDLRQRTGLPWTQVAVAIAFLKERSCVIPCHGRNHQAAGTAVYEDAMIEWHALREKGET